MSSGLDIGSIGAGTVGGWAREAKAKVCRTPDPFSKKTIGMGLIDVVWLEWGWGPDP